MQMKHDRIFGNDFQAGAYLGDQATAERQHVLSFSFKILLQDAATK